MQALKSIASSINYALAGPATLLSIAISLFAYAWGPGETVKLGTLITVLAILILIIIILLNLTITYYQRQNQIPRVVMGSAAPAPYQNASALLILSPSILFSHDALVSIYKSENDAEVLIGCGVVVNIQENHYIQVAAHELPGAAYHSDWNDIVHNNSNTTKKLIIKPTIAKVSLGMIKIP